MSRVASYSVWDLSTKFPGRQIGIAMSRVWQVQGQHIVPAVDALGSVAHCPISLQDFDDPVLLSDGFVYNKRAIAEWLQSHNTSPCTNAPLMHRSMLRLQPLGEAVELLLSETHRRQDCKADIESEIVAGQEFLSQSLLDLQATSDMEIRLQTCIDKISDCITSWQKLMRHARQVQTGLLI